jgi:peptide/nickel transport system ATP-binding protein
MSQSQLRLQPSVSKLGRILRKISEYPKIPFPDSSAANILEVKGLKTYFFTQAGTVKAVDGVDFAVRKGEILGLVGESGCGKSVTSLSIMRLITPPGRIIEGRVSFNGDDLMTLSEKEMTEIRGDQISMIFQQPQSSLNPVFKVGDQIAEVIKVHQRGKNGHAWKQAVELLHKVGIPDAEQKAHAYPYQMSGGQAQRVMIAITLALNPELLIADEPTTALDVTIQAQILDLIRSMRNELHMAVLLITHDLGVIAETADNVAVMYAGRFVEQTDAKTLFEKPLHPYTLGLIASIPVLGKVKDRLDVIPGIVPDLIDLPVGCKFAPRCRKREEYGLQVCIEQEPEFVEVQPGHLLRCWLYLSNEKHIAPLRVG